MPFIEIRTVHSVVVSYQTASLQDRVIAFALDQAVLLIILLISIILLGTTFEVNSNSIGVVCLVIYALYGLICEALLDGRTFGKMFLGIKVVKLNGREATFEDYFVRWIFRLVDIFLSLGALACLLVSALQKGQRLGDIFANTVVIKTRNENIIALHSLTALENTQNYVPTYPEAGQMNEKQALLIKSVLDRNKTYQNETSRELVLEMTLQVEKFIGKMAPKHQTNLDFLKTVLKDYVVLTR